MNWQEERFEIIMTALDFGLLCFGLVYFGNRLAQGTFEIASFLAILIEGYNTVKWLVYWMDDSDDDDSGTPESLTYKLLRPAFG